MTSQGNSAFSQINADYANRCIVGTLKQMMEDRGYTIDADLAVSASPARADLALSATPISAIPPIPPSSTPRSKVFVYLCRESKVSVKKMREYIDHMQKEKVSHCVIVYADQVTTSAKNENPHNFDIETFRSVELLHNPTRHVLASKHKLLSDAEVQEVMKHYKMDSREKFPRYSPDDIVVRYHHWNLDSVVKIHRSYGGQKEPEIVFRHVRL